MTEAANKAETAAGDILTNMTTLMTSLEGMTQGLRGSAGTAFQNVKGKIEINLRAITDDLNEVASGIRTSGTDFDISDQEAASQVEQSFAGADEVYDRLVGGK